MSLRSEETMEAFINKITYNSEIMNILNLPTILKTDTEDVKLQKRKRIIDKVIVKSSQEWTELAKKFPEITIDGITYSNYGNTRISISMAQSIKTNSYLFGNPQVDISIFYDNTNMENVFRLLDLISDEFSGQNLVVDLGNEKQMLKEIKCEGITSQVAMINNYERIGIRFSFYATLYKN
jgi:hypothetical protein